MMLHGTEWYCSIRSYQSKRLNSGGNANATGATTGGGLVNPDKSNDGARIKAAAAEAVVDEDERG